MMSFVKRALKPLLQKPSPEPEPAPDKIWLTLPVEPLAIKPVEEKIHAQATPSPSVAEAAAATGVVLPRSQNDPVAVLTLGDKGEILSARGNCVTLFGRDGDALEGRNIGVLLQGGLDNAIGRFLLRRQNGKVETETILLRVTVLRKDGTSFPASVTTPTWSQDRRLIKGPGDARQGWTVALRSLAGQTESPAPCPELAAPIQTAQTAPPPPPTFPAREPLPLQAPRLPAGLMTNYPPRAPQQQPTAGAPAQSPLQPMPMPGPALNAGKAQPEPANEQPRLREVELRAELDATKEAVGYTEAALKEETSRKQELEQRLQQLTSTLTTEQAERENRFADAITGITRERDELKSRLEGSQSSAQELAELRKQRDDLSNQLKAEGVTAADARQRAQALTDRINANTTELERLRTECEAQAAERARAEAKWRAEIEQRSAKATEDTSRLQQELFALRRERDELKARPVTGDATDTGFKRRAEELQARLDQNTAELERVQSELDAQHAEREQAEAKWRAQIENEKSRKSEMEESWAAVIERNIKFDEELSSLRQTHDELLAQVSADQSGADESRQRVVELEARLSENAAELERVTAALAAEQDEHSRVDSARDQQLEAERASKQELETACHDALRRKEESEAETANLHKVKERLTAELSAGRQTAVEAAQRINDLERCLRDNESDLKQVRTDLEAHYAERERVEADWRRRLDAAHAEKLELKTARSEAAERNRHLDHEMAGLRQQHDKLLGQIKAEQTVSAEARRRAQELESRLDQNAVEFEQTRNKLAQRQSELDRVESEWGAQLEAAKALIRKLETAWAGVVERNRRLERELAAFRQERDNIQGRLASTGLATQSGTGRNGTHPHRTSVPTKPSTPTTRPYTDGPRPVSPLPHEPCSIKPATPALRPADRRPNLNKETGTAPLLYNLQP